jgi:dihydrolipoamide dehydrogenase
MADFDVVVLGAGPGGYVAAIRAAQLGLKAAVVEEKYWGGVCLNVGCIPSKALLKNAELAHVLTHEKAKYGIEGDATMSYGPTHARSRQVSAGIVKGVHFLMKKNKIEEINGWGTLTSPTSMDVKGADGSVRSITFDNLIIATGSVTRMIPGVQVSERRHLRGADPRPRPARLDHHRRLGRHRCRIRLCHAQFRRGRDDRRVPRPDGPDRGRGRLQGARQALQEARRQGHARHQGRGGRRHRVRRAGHRVPGRRRRVERARGRPAPVGDRFRPARAGFRPRVTGVALTDRGAIAIDGRGRTNVPGVYAIGDVTAKMMLAHVAEAMGIVAAETIAGAETMEIDFTFIPRATYCQPQIGSMGLSEAQAKDKGYAVKTATFPFAANGKAQGLGDAVGFVKIVADAEHNEILGAHMIGPDVTELLPVLNAAQTWDLTADELSRVVFAHPTLGEAVKEALHGIAGHMINL